MSETSGADIVTELDAWLNAKPGIRDGLVETVHLHEAGPLILRARDEIVALRESTMRNRVKYACARAEALEEAARQCEHSHAGGYTLLTCAAAIRALRDRPHERT